MNIAFHIPASLLWTIAIVLYCVVGAVLATVRLMMMAETASVGAAFGWPSQRNGLLMTAFLWCLGLLLWPLMAFWMVRDA